MCRHIGQHRTNSVTCTSFLVAASTRHLSKFPILVGRLNTFRAPIPEARLGWKWTSCAWWCMRFYHFPNNGTKLIHIHRSADLLSRGAACHFLRCVFSPCDDLRFTIAAHSSRPCIVLIYSCRLLVFHSLFINSTILSLLSYNRPSGERTLSSFTSNTILDSMLLLIPLTAAAAVAKLSWAAACHSERGKNKLMLERNYFKMFSRRGSRCTDHMCSPTNNI